MTFYICTGCKMKEQEPLIIAPLPLVTRQLKRNENEKLGFGVLLIILYCFSVVYIGFLIYKRCHGVRTHDVSEKKLNLETVINANQPRSLNELDRDCNVLQSLSSLSNQSYEEKREIL